MNCVGTYNCEQSDNPSFVRGILKGLARTLKANQNDVAIVLIYKDEEDTVRMEQG